MVRKFYKMELEKYKIIEKTQDLRAISLKSLIILYKAHSPTLLLITLAINEPFGT